MTLDSLAYTGPGVAVGPLLTPSGIAGGRDRNVGVQGSTGQRRQGWRR